MIQYGVARSAGSASFRERLTGFRNRCNASFRHGFGGVPISNPGKGFGTAAACSRIPQEGSGLAVFRHAAEMVRGTLPLSFRNGVAVGGH